MQKNYIVILLIAALAIKANTLKAQIDTNDSLALVDLYNSTDGPHWLDNTGWPTNAPVSQRYGINLIGNRVSEIGLSDNQLAGLVYY